MAGASSDRRIRGRGHANTVPTQENAIRFARKRRSNKAIAQLDFEKN
jgi:hypothetical protein